MNKRKKHITSVISLRLLFVVVIAYLVSTVLSYAIQYRRADRENLESLTEVISETVESIRPGVEREVLTQAVLYIDSLSARMLANPVNATAEAEASFPIWVESYAVSEMDLVDRSGVITVSTDETNVGYDLHDQPELARFLDLFDGEDGAAEYFDGAMLHDASIVRYCAAKIPGVDALLVCGTTQQDIDEMLLHYASGDLEHTILGQKR